MKIKKLTYFNNNVRNNMIELFLYLHDVKQYKTEENIPLDKHFSIYETWKLRDRKAWAITLASLSDDYLYYGRTASIAKGM